MKTSVVLTCVMLLAAACGRIEQTGAADGSSERNEQPESAPPTDAQRAHLCKVVPPGTDAGACATQGCDGTWYLLSPDVLEQPDEWCHPGPGTGCMCGCPAYSPNAPQPYCNAVCGCPPDSGAR